MIRDKVSRQDLAKMVGASREMVSRVMKDLEERGFIETRSDGSMLVKERLSSLGLSGTLAVQRRVTGLWRLPNCGKLLSDL